MYVDEKKSGEQQTTDLFTLESLIAWLEKQPVGQTYCYTSNDHCLLQQYYTHCGFKHVSVSRFGNWSHSSVEDMQESPAGFYRVAIMEPWTFGAALERARAVANER